MIQKIGGLLISLVLVLGCGGVARIAKNFGEVGIGKGIREGAEGAINPLLDAALHVTKSLPGYSEQYASTLVKLMEESDDALKEAQELVKFAKEDKSVGEWSRANRFLEAALKQADLVQAAEQQAIKEQPFSGISVGMQATLKKMSEASAEARQIKAQIEFDSAIDSALRNFQSETSAHPERKESKLRQFLTEFACELIADQLGDGEFIEQDYTTFLNERGGELGISVEELRQKAASMIKYAENEQTIKGMSGVTAANAFETLCTAE